MTTYTARASREEGWWTVTVDEVPGLFTQARRLDQIPAQVQDALTLFPEVEENPQTATVNVIPDPAFTSVSAPAIELQRKALKTRAKATHAAQEAASDLYALGLSYRDIGTLLGVSFQHAQKLATGTPSTEMTASAVSV